MLPPNSIGRNQLSPRFTAIVRILNVEYLGKEELQVVYQEYFRALLKHKDMEQSMATNMAQFIVDVYNQIQTAYSVDVKRHYNFTPKHLFRMFKSFIKYNFTDK